MSLISIYHRNSHLAGRLLTMSDEEFVLLAYLWHRRRKRRERKRTSSIWVHAINEERSTEGVMAKLYPHLIDDEQKFFNYVRMSRTSFEELLSLLSSDIYKMDTNYRRAISSRDRLLLTLRFLASGEDYNSLHYQFRMGSTTVRGIVYEMCKVIWACLREMELPKFTTASMYEVAGEFEKTWNFPHCIGAIDGKHIQIQTGSKFFNYKQKISIILQAIADANSNFIAIDVGNYGRQSDGGVLKHSSFGRALFANEIPIPSPESILDYTHDNITFPYVFLGDEAYPLTGNILRPYPRRLLTENAKVYNYRHSRARKSVECAFGIMANKWRALLKPLCMNPSNATTVVLAMCVLHNFVKSRDGKNVVDMESSCPLASLSEGARDQSSRPTQDVMDLRDSFSKLFVSCPSYILEWQWEYANAIAPVLEE